MTEEIPKKIVQPLDIKEEARPHSLTGGDIEYPRIPHASESIAACVELGLLRQTETGYESTGAKMKMDWAGMGVVEIKQLAAAIWHDMPATGVQWSDVLARARLLGSHACGEPSIQSKVAKISS